MSEIDRIEPAETSRSSDGVRAIVLLSGGMDSATVLAIAREQGYRAYALSVRYGQRHGVELECAARLARALGAERHIVAEIDLRAIGGSALTGDDEVPKGRCPEQMAREIPITYVPARNTIFLSLALAWAEVLAARDIFIGVNALDYSGYPDCRPEYIEAFERVANLATRAAVRDENWMRIRAPLIRMSKGQIVRTGVRLGVDFAMTTSCYDPAPDARPCGACDACLLRARGFAEAGVTDPLLARAEST
jgi:7-cyano-7-deazaguanine synthase